MSFRLRCILGSQLSSGLVYLDFCLRVFHSNYDSLIVRHSTSSSVGDGDEILGRSGFFSVASNLFIRISPEHPLEQGTNK